jgi:hypothetical protein
MKQTFIKKPLSKAEKAISEVKKIISNLNESDTATFELLLDKEAQRQIAQSRAAIKRGEFVTLDEFRDSYY